MPIALGLLFLAAGAIMAFAVETNLAGVDIDAVGIILMVCGAVGLVWGLLATSSIGPWHRTDRMQ